MNIWIIDHYASEPKYGGISRQYDFAVELSARGHNVAVISSSFSHFSHRYIAETSCSYSDINEKAHFVYVHTSPYAENNSMKRLANMLSFVRSVGKHRKKIANHLFRPDVVIGCSIHPFTWVAAYNAAKSFSARFYAEVRDLWPATWIYNRGMSAHNPKAVLFGRLERWAYDRADKVIYSMSRGDKYICDILGYPKEKTVWIDQPMDCERFDANSQRYTELSKEITNFIGNSFLCVFTGYYVDYEGVYEMLRAAKLLHDKGLPIKFVFVGSGREQSGMEKFVSDNALDNVYVGNRISKELVPALLERAQICLAHLAVRGNPQSYKFDASKNKLTEYLYSDSCVIYGTYIENQFVKTSGGGITIEPYSAEAFTQAITEVFNVPAKQRAEFGVRGRQYVKENNTVSILIDKYLAALEN